MMKISIEKQATLISSSVAFVLTVLKLSVGVFSGSVAVLASAIDSVMDMFVSIFNYFAISSSQKPSDKYFNYGKGKIEAIACVIEGVIIVISGVFLLYQSIKKYYTNEPSIYLDVALVVMAVSFVITYLLVAYLNYVASKTNNMVIKADALHYKTDLYANGVVFVSLALVYVTNIELIDVIAGGSIALWIIYSAYDLVKSGIFILLDRAVGKDIVEKIQNIINNQPLINSFHYLRTRQAGDSIFIEVHIVFDDDDIKLIDAHEASDEIENEIMKIDKSLNWVINVHLDPHDDS